MANDRLFIVNKKTKKYLCLAKHMGGPWYLSNRFKDLQLFFDDIENQDSFLKDEHCYEILYEDEITDEHLNFELQ